MTLLVDPVVAQAPDPRVAPVLSPRLLVGVHADSSLPLGPLIAAVTRSRLGGEYVLGEPATHAFTVIEHADGIRWRLDAQPPRAEWTPWRRYLAPDRVALWELRLDEHAVAAGIEHARGQTGRPYDLVELAGQLTRLLAPLGGVRGADICTSLVVEVLRAVGGPAEDLVRDLPDRFPERLARALTEHEHHWWLRRLPSIEVTP